MNSIVWKWLTVLSLGVIIALQIHGIGLVGGQPGPNKDSSPTPDATIVRLLEEVAVLRRQVADLQSHSESQLPFSPLAERVMRIEAEMASVQSTAQTALQPAYAAATGTFDPTVMAADFEEREQQRFAAIETRLQYEPIDGKWSLFAANTLYSALETQDAVELEIDNIECRSTLCRVDA